MKERRLKLAAPEDLERLYKFAKELLKHGKEIPDEIIQSISKSSYYSHLLARELLESGKKYQKK
jgi:hypothetical protein